MRLIEIKPEVGTLLTEEYNPAFVEMILTEMQTGTPVEVDFDDFLAMLREGSKNKSLRGLGVTTPVIDERPTRVFTTSLMDISIKKFGNNTKLMEKLATFIEEKRKNANAQVSANDKNLHPPLDGIRESGLAGDYRVLYTLHSKHPTILTLYGIYTHDEMGTGTPAHQSRQKALSKQITYHSTDVRPYEPPKDGDLVNGKIVF